MDDGMVYGYMILMTVSTVIIYPYSVYILNRKTQIVAERTRTDMDWCCLAFGPWRLSGENIVFINIGKLEWWFHLNSLTDQIEMALFVLRYVSNLLIFALVSFFSTSPELSNKQRFEYFTRTIPSDHYQVKAMVDIVLTMGWSYVSIIYEESNYGIKAFEELEELLGKHNICIAVKEKLVKDSGVAEETAYDNIVSKLLTKHERKEVAGVMRAVRRCNATGAFSWIGSDGWSARGLVSNDNEPEVEGTLSVQPQANPVKGFEEYFLNLTVENNRRNPWFVVSETARNINAVFGEGSTTKATVGNWFKNFRDGDFSLANEPRGRPKTKAFEELEELLGKHNICIAVKEKLVKDSGVAEETAYDNIVSKLLTKPRAKAINKISRIPGLASELAAKIQNADRYADHGRNVDEQRNGEYIYFQNGNEKWGKKRGRL
ncbi:hypothetical protein DMN91_012232 [Ooceraea biroi]|uniref:Receptor ligand binding region domain-containing protein n=1 Tax=Ooceraea biroi TaxID=2015173 RepID=A0A3L8D5W2_OOCBI|nr:hypothetical protein DMN91_012232 [Ooceraea biroi]